MPSTVTHAYFIMDIYDKLPINRKIFLKDQKNYLKTFAQSMDPLNFYMNQNLKRSKKIRSFAYTFHTRNTSKYLITLTNYIKYNYYSNDPQVMSFLYGMISHYVLDSTLHPYIFYKTGIMDKRNPNTYKYNSMHHILETNIDRYLIKNREKINPCKYKHYKYIINNNKYSSNLKDVIDFTFKETFGINNFSKILIRATKNMKFSFKLLRYDKHGYKLLLYKSIDKITPKKCHKTAFLSYNNKIHDKNYLNSEKKEWTYPTNKRKKSNKSFIELYIDALTEAIKIIRGVDMYIYNDKATNLNFLIKNKSYLTGIELTQNQEMKYFEY